MMTELLPAGALHSGPVVHPRPALHSRSLPVASPSVLVLAAHPFTPAHPAFLAERLHLLPLVRRQLLANLQEKSRIRFLQFAARRHNLVNLGNRRRVVGLVSAHQRLHRQLCLFKVRPQIDQFRPVSHHDVVH